MTSHLNESTVEAAALEWLRLRQGFRLQRGFGGQVGELSYAVGHGPHLHQSRTLATLRDTLRPKLLSEELSVAEKSA